MSSPAQPGNSESMPARGMMALRAGAEREVWLRIGRFVVAFSRFVTSLHLCVAWHDDGKRLEQYGETASGRVASKLIRLIEAQPGRRFGGDSEAYAKYKEWAVRANHVRDHRNKLMHSRCGIETYGRHAIAVTTPITVEPAAEVTYSLKELDDLCDECDRLNAELNRLRKSHPKDMDASAGEPTEGRRAR